MKELGHLYIINYFTDLLTALDGLATAGLIERGPNGEICAVNADANLDDTVDLALTQQTRRKQFDQSRLHMIRDYAETTACRREYILSYFGEPFTTPCGSCDNCENRESDNIDYLEPCPIGSEIIHTSFGKGQVMR